MAAAPLWVAEVEARLLHPLPVSWQHLDAEGQPMEVAAAAAAAAVPAAAAALLRFSEARHWAQKPASQRKRHRLALSQVNQERWALRERNPSWMQRGLAEANFEGSSMPFWRR